LTSRASSPPSALNDATAKGRRSKKANVATKTVECGNLLGVTIEQIVSAIRALPVLERLRVIELVAHEAASDVPAKLAESAPTRGVTLIERNGLLVVDSDAAVSADAFDHRLEREARADRIWGGGS
jgi:hypothetical protein